MEHLTIAKDDNLLSYHKLKKNTFITFNQAMETHKGFLRIFELGTTKKIAERKNIESDTDVIGAHIIHV